LSFGTLDRHLKKRREKDSGGRPIGPSGISHQEIGGEARINIAVGCCFVGRSPDRSSSIGKTKFNSRGSEARK
jgi:hypothetical protein